jgi:ABC-type transport system involved in multi-copper enzyme maturation permease subunit
MGLAMKNAISAEFLKLRRSRVLLLAAIASALPPAVKCLRHALGNLDEASSWRGFLSSSQELAVFGMLMTVMLLAAFLFTMEYQYGTAGAIFTSGTGRSAIFGAKIAALGVVIMALLAISAASQLLFGALATAEALPAALFGQFASVTAWYAFSYLALAAVVALPAVLTKRFTLTAVITMGYYIMIFPFHTKNPYVCPFMTPAVVASRLYGSVDYIFSFGYENLPTGVLPAAAFLTCLAGVSSAIGVSAYRKSDAVR